MKDRRTGDTALVLALRSRQLELACDLLDAGADPDAQNVDGESAVHACVALATRERSQGWRARETLVLGVLRGLLRRGAADPRLTAGPLRRSPLHVAAASRPGEWALASARVLLDHDPGLADLRDGEGNAVLSVAVGAANDDLSAMVVDAGCVLDAVNIAGDSALHLAVAGRPGNKDDLCFFRRTP